MKHSFIHIQLKDKSNIINKNKILQLFKLSLVNNITNLDYNINKKETSNQNLKMIFYKKYIKKNIGKITYKNKYLYQKILKELK